MKSLRSKKAQTDGPESDTNTPEADIAPQVSEAELPQDDAEPQVMQETQDLQETQVRSINMSMDISTLEDLAGFIGGCVVDSETGLMLASVGGGALDLEAAGAANTEVVKAKLAAIDQLGLDDAIEDILITLGKQFHLIRPLEKNPTVFMYVALDKKSANLGMARLQVKKLEATLEI